MTMKTLIKLDFTVDTDENMDSLYNYLRANGLSNSELDLITDKTVTVILNSLASVDTVNAIVKEWEEETYGEAEPRFIVDEFPVTVEVRSSVPGVSIFHMMGVKEGDVYVSSFTNKVDANNYAETMNELDAEA